MFKDEDFESEFGWDHAESLAIKAYSLYEQGLMSQALEQLELAIEASPADTALYFNKALTLDAMEMFEEAIQCYKTAIESKPEDPEIYNSLAVDYTRTGYYDLAIETFGQALEIDPNFEPAYCNQIITYTEMGKHDKAEEIFYLAQQINPDCPLCFYNIGNSMFCRSELKRAIWCWEKTKSLDPSHPQINYRIAQAYWTLNQPAQANKYFLEQLRQDPGDIDILMEYAIFLLQSENIPSATEKFNRILELEPDFAPAYHYLGEINLNAGKIEQAQVLFEKALEIDDFPGPGFRLGQCYLKQGRNNQSAELIKKELRYEIDNADVLMTMGTMLLELGENDFASNCFLKATDQDPKNHLPFYYLGLSMFNSGEPADAVHFFSYAIDLNANHIDSLKMLALCYENQNQFSKAIECLDDALEISPDSKELKRLRKNIRIKALKIKIASSYNETLDRLKFWRRFN